MNGVPNNFMRLLTKNGWQDKTYNFMKEDYFNRLKRRYEKGNYDITDELLMQLTYVYDSKLSFINRNGRSNTLIFASKNAYRYSTDYRKYLAEKIGCKTMIYLGTLQPGLLNIWIDDEMRVWGDYDFGKVFFGRGLYAGILNICSDAGEWTRTSIR